MTNSEKLHMHIQLIKEEMKMSFTYPDEPPDDEIDMDDYEDPSFEENYDEDYIEDEEESDSFIEDENPLDETENESIEEPIPDTSEEEGREYITYDEV